LFGRDWVLVFQNDSGRDLLQLYTIDGNLPEGVFLLEKVKGVARKHWKPKFATPSFVPRYKEKVERTLREKRRTPTFGLEVF
jgi:hypothetical protein